MILIKGVSRVKYACASTFSGEPNPLFDREAVGRQVVRDL